MRHAEADRSDPLAEETVRPLSPAGERAVASLAEQLAGLGLAADVLLSSQAVCSRATAGIIAAKLSLKVLIDRRLYDGGVVDFQEVVRSLEHSHNTAILVGHNSSLSEFMRYLTDANREDIPPGSAVIVDLAINIWHHVFIGKGLFRTQLFPPEEVVEIKEDAPPPPRGWKDRLCHWLDLKIDEDVEKEEPQSS